MVDKLYNILKNKIMSDWKFCNTELKSKTGYCSDYYCPKCKSESGLVNIFGTCATKVNISKQHNISKNVKSKTR